MNTINTKRTIPGSNEEVIAKVTEALKTQGFGVLTRIDLHAKIKEKLGKDLAPAVILGACNPQLAFDAYTANPDVASLLPCNAVVREIGPGQQSVELALPSAMMKMLGNEDLVQVAREADQRLSRALDQLASAAS